MGWMMECAAEGCERSIKNDSGVILTRISLKGGPFVGLCQDCIVRTVVLKQGAARALEQEVS